MSVPNQVKGPSWLNKEFFENIFKKSEKDDNLKVTSLTITPATPTNDHYASLMFRTKVEYKSRENLKAESLIVKTLPEMKGIKKDMLSDTFIFKTEIRMYVETIPKMEAILRKYGDNTVFAPKVIYTAMVPNEVIVLEDLVEKGYTTLKNRMPTNEEISEAMLKIAKWHAVSFKLAKEEPESITNYNDGGFNLDIENIEFFMTGIKNFIRELLSTDNELKEYIKYFEEVDKTKVEFVLNLCNAFKRCHKALFVLNHGDFHSKNMMFRYKANEELDDLMFVDFQMCFYGPAVTDLLYSVYMFWDSDTRWNRRDEMIHYYFSNLSECLKKIEYKSEVPKMADLQIDLIKYRQFEAILVATNLPVVLALFAGENLQIDQVIESSDYRMKLFLNPVLREEIRRTLPRLLHKGVLE